MDKRFWAVIGVIVVIFAGILVVSNQKKGGSSNDTAKPTSHIMGDKTSPVTLLEYGDYECPACESFFPTTQAVQEKYKDSVKFQFRNLPLTQIHPNAFAGARAAEAADLQGKFEQMHDALYDSANWSQWSTSSNPNPYFWQYAKQLGLNVDQFKSDFASETVNDRVNADINAFKKTGRPLSTPTFFLNGKFVDNSSLLGPDGQPSVDAFSKVLDAALAKAK
jgi:protein-disulfide isomerase